MSVQDEQNQKIAKITMEASKMTLKNFMKTIKFLVINAFKLPKLKTKQSLKTLSKTEKSISKIDLENLELKNKDFKIFKQIAKNCGLKYSMAYDKNTNKYTFFFGSGKAEIYEQVYSQLRKALENKNENKQKSTLKEKIKNKQDILNKNKEEKKLF